MSTTTPARHDTSRAGAGAVAELATAATLVARTVELTAAADMDLLAVGAAPDGVVWQRDRAGLAGRGEALRISLPDGLDRAGSSEHVAAVLGAIGSEDEVGLPGCGPVAIGALPFDRRVPGSVVVPAVIAGRAADGTRWLTTISPASSRRPDPVQAIRPLTSLPAMTPPDSFSLVSGRPHAEWREVVGRAVAAIGTGDFAKVVLAREVLVQANRQLVPVDILRRLHALYPSCIVFAADGFIGASPELLVSRFGHEVASHPLAGTIPHSGDPVADQRAAAELLASPKERHEHRLVAEAVTEVLAPLCEQLDVPEAPSIVSLRNVSHLGTLVRGRLAATSQPSALDLVARLHPTPAVAGTPNDEAVAYLLAVEGFDRGRYAGPVGWMDANGDGAWAVGIRSAEIQGHRARLFAGVGVVADSDPDSELAETQLKLQALLAAVVRP